MIIDWVSAFENLHNSALLAIMVQVEILLSYINSTSIMNMNVKVSILAWICAVKGINL